MPLHMRGAWYFGDKEVSKMLNCRISHSKLADEIYQAIVVNSRTGYKSVACESCGSTISVTARGLGEWEFREFPPSGKLERR